MTSNKIEDNMRPENRGKKQQITDDNISLSECIDQALNLSSFILYTRLEYKFLAQY